MIDLRDVGVNVSRETSQRLDDYLQLLKKWNQSINLVSPTTLENASVRHFKDSAQLLDLARHPIHRWVDMGSGAGFPGLVVAIILAQISPDTEVEMIESDMRKATFLRNVLRVTGITARVFSQRIETLDSRQADVLSARALAPLPQLLDFASRHLSSNGYALFQKGQTWEKEVADAERRWHFAFTPHKSKTDANAVILEIGDLAHV